MNGNPKSGWLNARHAYLLGLIALAVVIFHHSLAVVIGSSLSVDQYSHILMVLPISAILIYMERRKILAKVVYSVWGGTLYLAFMGAFAYIAWHSRAMDPSNYLSLSILLFACCCLAAFLFCCGFHAFRAAAFPLFFLILMTPLPDPLRIRVITFLQYGSALITDWFFTVAGISFVREGVILTFPTVTIEIAQECSGIRSSMILFLTGLVLGHLFLRSGWSKVALVFFLVPMTIMKNGLRIFALTTLGMYVDQSFLTGRLHHNGGIVFFVLAFMGLWIIVWLLQKLEGRVTSVNNHGAQTRKTMGSL